MSSKIFWTLPAVLLLALMTACSSGGNQGGASAGVSTPFIGGSQGLKIDFMEGAPPPEVYDGGTYDFSVTTRIENVGEHTVPPEDVQVKITGIDPVDFGGSDSNVVFTNSPVESLIRTQKDPNGNLIMGTVDYLEFGPFNFKGQLSGNTEFRLRADMCYLYKSTANAKLCVIDDVLDFNAETVCEVNEKKTVYNSGAPIHIASFEQQPAGADRLSFTFEIQHVGTGRIYDPAGDPTPADGSAGACAADLMAENKVDVTVTTGIGNADSVSCPGLEGNSGTVTLYQNKRAIRCTQDLSGASASDFEKVVKIDVEYAYKDSIEAPLLVKHAPEFDDGDNGN